MPRLPHTQPLTQATPLRLRLALAWLLLALVLAPMLGRMHQVLHMPAGVDHSVHGHAGQQQVVDALHALFAGHGDADCQVLDQQTLVGAALGQAPALLQAQPQLPPAGAPAPAPGTGGAAPFHARAPPLRA